jgi:aconitate hydratase
MFGIPKGGECDYSQVHELDLNSIQPGVAGPKRPQDRIDLPQLKEQFLELLRRPTAEGGYGKTDDEIGTRYHVKIGHDRNI